MRRPDATVWEAVAQKELGMIRDMGVYSLARLPPGRKAIGSRFVFEFKIDRENLIPKARLVAKGFHQVPGVDFGKTFAPVAKAATIRMISAVACHLGWHLECFDATRAFLWGELEEELYMKLPDGFVLPSDVTFPPGFLELVWRLWRSIYGLKQASRVWYKKLKGVLMSLGLTMSEADHALFMFHGRWREALVHCLIAVHVDDGMGGCNSREFLDWVKAGILAEFGLKDLGPVSTFLGVQFKRDLESKELWIHQESYIDTLLADYDMTNCNPVSMPMDPVHPFGRPGDSYPHVPDLTSAFQTMNGRLLFLSLFTRPDICYAVNRLTQFNANPEPCHYAAGKRLIRYLKGTKSLRLHYGGDGQTGLVAYSDSDWAGEPDRYSVSGYAWFFHGCLVSWGSKKQRSITLSSTEAEYVAMALAFQEGIWLRSSLTEANITIPSPIYVLGDNEGAISLAHNSSSHSKAKHIDLKHHFIRDLISSGDFELSWIPSRENTADVLTKPLDRQLLEAHVVGLGLASR
jgi:hypothetical protein